MGTVPESCVIAMLWTKLSATLFYPFSTLAIDGDIVLAHILFIGIKKPRLDWNQDRLPV